MTLFNTIVYKPPIRYEQNRPYIFGFKTQGIYLILDIFEMLYLIWSSFDPRGVNFSVNSRLSKRLLFGSSSQGEGGQQKGFLFRYCLFCRISEVGFSGHFFELLLLLLRGNLDFPTAWPFKYQSIECYLGRVTNTIKKSRSGICSPAGKITFSFYVNPLRGELLEKDFAPISRYWGSLDKI